MTHRRSSITIQTQLTSLSKCLCTIDHHLATGDHGRARLEMECIMTITMELHKKLSFLENTGRQPEERLIIMTNMDSINPYASNS